MLVAFKYMAFPRCQKGLVIVSVTVESSGSVGRSAVTFTHLAVYLSMLDTHVYPITTEAG